jgi:hypothetical protein
MRSSSRIELPRILVPALCRRMGVSRARARTEVARGNWRVIARGVLLTRPERPTRSDWADAGVALGGAGACLTGWDALRVMGAGPPRPVGRVLVLTPVARSRTVGGVYIRRSDRPVRRTITSPAHPTAPCTSVAAPARAAADAALECSSLVVVRSLVTSVLQRRLCSLDDIAAELDVGPRNDSALLRQAVHLLGDGARSEAEVQAVRRLTRAPVPPFEVNVPVVDETGALLYVVDVLWRALRAGLEVDSRECHFSDADWQRTLDRHNQLTRFGLSMTHYAPSRIGRRGDPWLREVADWLTRRSSELGVGAPRRHGVRRAEGAAPPPFVVRRNP